MEASLPRVVFSMGDPNGIGPEVLLKALHDLLPRSRFRPLIFGDPQYLKRLRSDLGLPSALDAVDMVRVGECPYPPRWGQPQDSAGELAVEALRQAAGFCREEGLDLLVTAPIHKGAAHQAGFSFPGQTEFIASFFPNALPAMAFFSDRLHVLLVTVHVPLSEVGRHLSVELILAKTLLFASALEALQGGPPRLAVCGLNPHASENGAFGSEEAKILEPAVRRLNEQLGVSRVQGPFPADSLFARVVERRDFDGVVAMYHDQGLIPLKLMAFDSAANVTLGLPIVRTSPDHGTGFDLAGKGRARCGSMVAAIEWGLKLRGKNKSTRNSVSSFNR